MIKTLVAGSIITNKETMHRHTVESVSYDGNNLCLILKQPFIMVNKYSGNKATTRSIISIDVLKEYFTWE